MDWYTKQVFSAWQIILQQPMWLLLGLLFESPSYKMQAILGCQKGGHDSRLSWCRLWRLWKLRMRVWSLCHHVLALPEQYHLQNAVSCEESLGRNQPYRFISHAKTLIVFGTVQGLYCLKACQISKVQAHSHKITNEPCTSSNYETLTKTNAYL